MFIAMDSCSGHFDKLLRGECPSLVFTQPFKRIVQDAIGVFTVNVTRAGICQLHQTENIVGGGGIR